ncbi:MAG TPA: hypothetical protein DEQ66_07300, partial [Prevotella sp.]|nr:hypothetical protein [Prevotella sp.]
HHALYIIRCNQDRFLYYLSVYLKSFKELFSFVAWEKCISQKRVQKYKLFSKHARVSTKKFEN